ncbi:MAG: peptide deformylase [Geminicoccaceae bacterium]|nr:peptide deformylase [Geminicoccaceae bacterium]MCS7268815.1 peptide deformylase [Geminicoccaceae bacterium]MCX7629908.1 peptide deformylase [Geminicoccaceae bacterium]MDW8124651.1 peptide deformylase [Geminicoccaceae bacterium]MDW8342538.1 peptide deformylase [Geminicoccaceae bacterium]
MAVRRILIAPHPLLKLKARPVERFDEELSRLLDDMLETMYRAPGIGLAAPQIGVSLRAVVVDLAKEGEPRAPLRIVNPEITWYSDELVTMEEGCLSLPEQFAEVTRPRAVRLRYRDERGGEHELEAEGLLARCLQHEVDHLDGILFVDRLSPLKRNIIMRKLAKARRARA